jgi:hypothetical protein
MVDSILGTHALRPLRAYLRSKHLQLSPRAVGITVSSRSNAARHWFYPGYDLAVSSHFDYLARLNYFT